jgi:PEP-CTERM motif
MRNCNVWFAWLMRLPTILLLGIMCAGIVAVCGANAMAIDSAVINTRIFNDDPTSTLTTTNSYPALVQISDTPDADVGFANRHNFHLADAGVEHPFANGEPFSFSADLTISGAGQGEAGLQVAPWWSPNVDGTFNFRTTDGEIAVFGGRLPFYSFTGSQGITYTKGDTVHVGVIYDPHSLSMADPATIQYDVKIGATNYTSGPLAFDEGNAAEGYGTWGHLDDARVGGYVQVFISGSGSGNNLTATWENMSYAVPEPTTFALFGLAIVGLTVLRRRSK